MAYIRRLPSGLWQATVRQPGGTKRTRTDPLKGVVRRWAEDAEAEIRRGEWADPHDGRITIGDWWERWSATRVIATQTRNKDDSHWRVHLEPRWGRVPLAQVTAWDVEAWIADMTRTGVSAATAHPCVRLLRHLFNDAVRHRLVRANPTAGVRVPKPAPHVDRFLSHEEYEVLEAEMPTARDRTVIRLMGYGGLRFEEAAGLHAHRLQLRQSRLLVREVQEVSGQIKEIPKSSAAQRYAPLEPTLLRMVREQQLAAGPCSHCRHQRMFPGIRYDNWRTRVWLPALERAGLDDPQPTPHDLRHTYGTWLAERGVPPTDIMVLMGHASLRMTERYVHATDARFDRAIAALRAPLVRQEPHSG